MTNAQSQPSEPLDLVPLPIDAVLLPPESSTLSPREMVLEAIKARLESQNLNWSIGPALDLNNPERLLSLNRIAVQLLTCGFTTNEIKIPLTHWYRVGAAPQLVVVGRVDEESQVVQITGLLTGEEFRQWIKETRGDQNLTAKAALEVPIAVFKGGMERLLTFVQLLHPDAISREDLSTTSAKSRQRSSVLDWLNGQLDEAIQAIGGSLIPAASGNFRSAVDSNLDALAILSIPIGLDNKKLCTGNTVQTCIERFRLLLIPIGTELPSQLLVRLIPEQNGDLLPDQLKLQAQQGDWQQTKTSEMNTELELVFSNKQQLIEVQVSYPGSTTLTLPALELPQ